MANKKDYDRWGKTCVKVVSRPSQKTVKKGKQNGKGK